MENQELQIKIPAKNSKETKRMSNFRFYYAAAHTSIFLRLTSWNELLLLSPAREGFGACPSPKSQHTQTIKEAFLWSLWAMTPPTPPSGWGTAGATAIPGRSSARRGPARARAAATAVPGPRAAPSPCSPRPGKGGRSPRLIAEAQAELTGLPPGQAGPAGSILGRARGKEPLPGRAPAPRSGGKGPRAGSGGLAGGTAAAARRLTAGRQARSGPGTADRAGALRRGCAEGMLGEDARRAQRDAPLRREQQRRRPLFKGPRRARGGRFMARTPSGAVPPLPSPGGGERRRPARPRSPPALCWRMAAGQRGQARPRQGAGGSGAAGSPGTAGRSGPGRGWAAELLLPSASGCFCKRT